MNPKIIFIPSTHRAIKIAAEGLRSLLKVADTPNEVINSCERALHELLTNQVDHAYSGDPHEQIRVYLMIMPPNIVMETRDTGVLANIDLSSISMPAPAKPAASDYGLPIIRGLVDEVSYSVQGGQNTWRLVKRLEA